MRRSLVLGDERAHHPFRQSLPPHVRGGQPVACRAEVAEDLPVAAPSLAVRYGHAAGHGLRKGLARVWGRAKAAPKAMTAADVRGFLLAYCACFVAVSAFVF